MDVLRARAYKAAISFFVTSTLVVGGTGGTLWWGAYRIQKDLHSALVQTNDTLGNIKLASVDVKEAARTYRTASEAQLQQLQDPQVQRSFGLFLRVGDDLNRMAKKSNNTIDNLNRILTQIDGETLPRVNQTLDSVNAIIVRCNDGVTLILDETNLTVRELRALLASPEIKQALVSFAAVADKSDRIAGNVDVSSAEIKNALPELVKQIRLISENTNTTTAEIALFLKRLNQPLSKKEKAFAAILRIVTASGPSVVELLRR